MTCPFFKVAYVGYCSACDFPYTPSILELKQQCFKDGFESCVIFKNLHATAQIATNQSSVESLKEVVLSVR